MPLPAYLKPIDILKPGADEEIKRMGELARAMVAFTLVCSTHGEFAWNVPEGKIELEETRHRIGEMCWHKLEAR